MGGNPYGKDVFKYGTDDWAARRDLDASRAAKVAAPKSVSTPFANSSTPYSPKVVNYGLPPARSSGGGGGMIVGLAKLFVVGFVLLAIVGYFGSQSNSGQRHVPVGEDLTVRESPPPPPVETTPVETSNSTAAAPAVTGSAGETPVVEEAPSAVPSNSTTAPLRLAGDDERVVAAVNEVQALSQQSFFVAKDGDALVFQGHLNTPEDDIYQTSFNVANLDLYHTTYSMVNRNLNIPCKAGASCASYAVFDSSAQETGGKPKYRTPYGSINVWSGSQEDASRILQDLQQLQGLQQ
jgi:hypothetical protein